MKRKVIQTVIVFFIGMLGVHCSFAQYKFEWQENNIDTNASIRGIHAINEDIIWLSGTGGTVAKSLDKGVTWEVLSVEGGEELDFRDIHAFDQDNVVIMSSGAGNKSKVFKTTDGGKSWTTVHANTHKDGFFNGIAFWDDRHGVLAGDPVDNHLYIATTSDGGSTWTKVPKSSIPEIAFEEYSFAGSGTHVVIYEEGQTWIGTGGKTARVFYSQDWGATWNVADTPITQGKSSTGIFSLKFKDKSFGIAVGGDYSKASYAHNNVIMTRDKGVTWSLIPEDMEFRSCIDYVDGFFIAVGSGGSSYSNDDGTSWHPIDAIGFHTLSIGGSKKAIWAAGDGGKVAKLEINVISDNTTD